MCLPLDLDACGPIPRAFSGQQMAYGYGTPAGMAQVRARSAPAMLALALSSSVSPVMNPVEILSWKKVHNISLVVYKIILTKVVSK